MSVHSISKRRRYRSQEKGTFGNRNKTQLIQCVYLLWNPNSLLVKIGITSDIKSRKASLESSCGSRLTLLALSPDIPGFAAKRFERKLHRFFKEQRKVGEWFDESICREAKHYIGWIRRRGVVRTKYIPSNMK